MRKTLLTLTILLSLPLVASAQSVWDFVGTFPPDTLSVDGNGVHGLAVDPDGKVWVQPYGGLVSIEFPDTVAFGTTKFKSLNQRAIFVYNPDGTQATFSPITFLKQGGAVVDTLGITYTGMVDIGGKSYKQYASLFGVGLRASPADGNIYVSQGNHLYRLDYKTGELMNVTVPYPTTTPTTSLIAPAVDGSGNVYITTVVRADDRPIKQFSDDLQEISASLISGITGFSRSFEVSRDGNTIYWAGYTTHAIHMYRRNDEFADFPTVPDTVLKGVDTESVTIHPVTNELWVSAGSANDRPNRYPGAETNYQIQTWYAFDQAELTAATPNPAVQDSLMWTGGGVGRPRALAFSPDGDIAYISLFSQPTPAVQKLIRKTVNAVEPTGEVPAGLALRGSYPNPASGVTTIEFALPMAAHATLKVYDTLGREVARVVDQMLAADTYRVGFDASALPAGLYVYRLDAGGHVLNGTMTVVR